MSPDKDLSPDKALYAEGARIMTLCNACRYCEGYCAVFRAMERRTVFSPKDLNYLANLCHNCGECYDACPYTPPHEYKLNVPQTLAEIRLQSYARPNLQQLALPIAALLSFAAIWAPSGATFYDVIPHQAMAGFFTVLGVAIVVALWIGVRNNSAGGWSFAAIAAASRDAAIQTNMHASARRAYHHATFYGFLLCFASTTVAAFYHFALHREAPYPYLSLPVILGVVGGSALLVGTSGQLAFRIGQRSELNDPAQRTADLTFIAMLWLTSATGLALLALRETPAMPSLLVIHLAIVFALFVTMPYGKFVHGLHRFAALVRNAREAGH